MRWKTAVKISVDEKFQILDPNMRSLLLAAALSSLLPARSSTGLGTLDDSKCDRRPYAAMQPLDLADLRLGTEAVARAVADLLTP